MIQGRLFSDELTEVVRTIHFFFFLVDCSASAYSCFANLCRRLFFFFWANFLVFWEEFNTPRFYPRIASERKKGSWCNYVLYAILKQIKNAQDGAFRGKGGGAAGEAEAAMCAISTCYKVAKWPQTCSSPEHTLVSDGCVMALLRIKSRQELENSVGPMSCRD